MVTAFEYVQTVLAFLLLPAFSSRDEGKDGNVRTEEQHVFLFMQLIW